VQVFNKDLKNERGFSKCRWYEVVLHLFIY